MVHFHRRTRPFFGGGFFLGRNRAPKSALALNGRVRKGVSLIHIITAVKVGGLKGEGWIFLHGTRGGARRFGRWLRHVADEPLKHAFQSRGFRSLRVARLRLRAVSSLIRWSRVRAARRSITRGSRPLNGVVWAAGTGDSMYRHGQYPSTQWHLGTNFMWIWETTFMAFGGNAQVRENRHHVHPYPQVPGPNFVVRSPGHYGRTWGLGNWALWEPRAPLGRSGPR